MKNMTLIVIVLLAKLFIISVKSAKDIQRIADTGFNYYNVQHQGMMFCNLFMVSLFGINL